MRTKANKDLTLRQRELVSREISREYKKWTRKKGEPTERERKQITAIGFAKARRRDPRIPKANPLDIGTKLITDVIGGIGFGIGAGITERYIMKRRKNPAANPPRFAVLDPEGTIVYARVATGTGDVARKAAHEKARELSRRHNATYFVWLSLTHKVGDQLNLAVLPGAYPISPEYNPLTRGEAADTLSSAHRDLQSASDTVGKDRSFLAGRAVGKAWGAKIHGPEREEHPGAEAVFRRGYRTGLRDNPRRRKADDIDSLIERAYYRHGYGVQIPIMDIPKLFRDVKIEIAGGTDLDMAVQNAIARYGATPQSNPLLMSENPHLVIDSHQPLEDRSRGVVAIYRGSPMKTFDRAYAKARKLAEQHDREFLVVAHPRVPSDWTPGVRVTPLFFMMGPYIGVRPDGSTVNYRNNAEEYQENPLLMTVLGANPRKARRRRKRRTNAPHTRRLKNPGRTKRKVTMSIQKFWAHLKRKGDPKLLAEFKKKIEGYRKWTHGSMPRTVTLELKNVPGMSGLWMTYGMGVQPESTYIMPKGSRRKGAWKHKWERHPELKGDPESGLILTQMAKGNKLTDFLHG